MRLLILLLFPLFLQAQVRITASPVPSDLGNANQYWVILEADQPTKIPALSVMAQLAEIGPLPGSIVVRFGEEQNRGGIRRTVHAVDQHAVPLTGILVPVFRDKLGISSGWALGIGVVAILWEPIKGIIGMKAPPDWEEPREHLADTATLAVAPLAPVGMFVYATRDAGTIRRTLGVPVSEPQTQPLRMPTRWLDSLAAADGLASEYERRMNQAEAERILARW